MNKQLCALIIDRSRAKSWRAADGSSILTPLGLHTIVISDRDGRHYDALDPATVTLYLVPSLDAKTIMHVIASCSLTVMGVSTTSELFLSTAAEVRAALKLPGHPPDYVARVRDKWLMKLHARRGAIPHARGLLGTDVLQGVSLAPAARYIVKPRDQSGARGVTELTTAHAVRDLLQSVRTTDGVLVEEFISGPMVHIDGYVTGSTTHYVLSAYERPPHRAGGRNPLSSYTVDDGDLIARAGEFIDSVVKVWGLREDVFHCEAFLVDSSFIFCELAGRPGGAGVPEAFDVIQGVDLRWTKTLLDLGLHPRSAPSRLGALHKAAGWTVLYERPPVVPHADSSQVVLMHADIRPEGQARVVGHAGVGAATFVFGGSSATAVRQRLATFEPGPDSSTSREFQGNDR